VVDYNAGAEVDVALDSGGSVSGALTAAGDLGGYYSGRVYLYEGSGSLIKQVYTYYEPAGTWKISGLVTGSYYVIARGGSDYRDEVWPGPSCDVENGTECLPTDGAPIPVIRGSETTDIDLSLEPYGRVTGQVVSSETGGAVSSGRVTLFDASGQVIRYDYNDNGVYSVTGVPPGTYYVATQYTSNHLDEVWGGGLCESACAPTEGTPITVGMAEDAVGPDFALDPASGIQGTVTELSSGLPLAGVAVDFWSLGGSWQATQVTDADGRYAIQLDSGPYFVTTDSDLGLIDEVWNNLACPDGSAYEGLCDPLLGQEVAVSQDSPYAEVSFALSGSDLMFEDGFENGLGSWQVVQ